MNQVDQPATPAAASKFGVRPADVEQYMRDLLTDTTPDAAARLAMRHLADGGGRSRARMATEAGHALALKRAVIIAIAAASELLHNASLIHDDIQDASALRRGQASIWKAHGSNVALCVGDLLVFRAFEALAHAGNQRFLSEQLRAMTTASAMAVRGQLADLSPAATLTLQDYEQLAIEKSGALLFLPLQLCLLAAGPRAGAWLAPSRSAVHAIAIAYQASDDLADQAEDERSPDSGHANLVAIMRSLGAYEPEHAVRAHARLRLSEASDHAHRLPDSLRQLIEQTVLQLNARLLP